MSKRSVLIVEDEAPIAEVLIAYCDQAGYNVRHLDRGGQVVENVKSQNTDLILLDLMIPEVDGITLCKQIRQFSNVPIIMVTAKTEEIDRLLGLELGADDYVCKPFSPREVIARINAILRRKTSSENESPSCSGFEVNREQYSVRYQNTSLDLTPAEFRLLETLVKQPDRVFKRDELIKDVYERDQEEITDRNIDTHIKNIRKKVKLINPDFNAIESVYAVGYRLKKEG